jgi:hypothetical protein
MSWDVLLLRLPPGITSVGDIPDNFGEVLGTTDEVRRLLAGILPTLDLTDPAWGVLESANYSIEFSIGADEPCNAVMLHVRGLDDALEPIQAVCGASGWQAIDCSSGDVIVFDADPARGLRAWREYRDRVAPGAPVKGVSLGMQDGKRVFFDDLQPGFVRPGPAGPDGEKSGGA